jgi:ribonuclease HI
MELMAVNHALFHLVRFNTLINPDIQIISDSEYVVNAACKPSSRSENLDMWAQFDSLTRNMSVGIDHLNRNTEAPQIFCDSLAHHLRLRLESFLESVTALPEFETMSLQRSSIV